MTGSGIDSIFFKTLLIVSWVGILGLESKEGGFVALSTMRRSIRAGLTWTENVKSSNCPLAVLRKGVSGRNNLLRWIVSASCLNGVAKTSSVTTFVSCGTNHVN